VLRLVKPPARNPRQPYLVSLHGLTRVRLIHLSKRKLSGDDLASMPIHDVEYPPTEKVPSPEVVEKFKQSALRLLDRLAKDSVQQTRKDGYNKIASMLDDITDSRTPWMADVLIGSVNGEYNDKLGKCIFISFYKSPSLPRFFLRLPST
jgi:ATP-dependent Lon protease